MHFERAAFAAARFATRQFSEFHNSADPSDSTYDLASGRGNAAAAHTCGHEPSRDHNNGVGR